MNNILLAFSILPITLFGANTVHSDQFNKGKAIYQETCISCHGVDGETNPAMQLVVKPRKLSQTILTQEQSRKIISEGAHFWGARADIMPAWKYVYSPDQIEAVSIYISEAFNPNLLCITLNISVIITIIPIRANHIIKPFN